MIAVILFLNISHKKEYRAMHVFNTDKTVEQYQKSGLFFKGEPGLIDTIHKSYPEIWALYKEMKSLDWSEDEFDYSRCHGDFKTVDPDMSDMMLETLMSQWELDSIASQFPLVLISPFEPCIEVTETETAIQANELVHANTYSEIVRMSFDNPAEVLDKLLSTTATFDRMAMVNKALADFRNFSVEYQYHRVFTPGFNMQETATEKLIEYYFIMLLLERIQFMASFAITFTICKSGPFAPIGQAVKKIAQDELEVHSEYRKEVLKVMIKDHPETFEAVRHRLLAMFKEVIDHEFDWTERLFKGRTLIGTNADLIKKWVLFNAKDVAHFIGFTKEETGHTFPRQNPMPFLEDWFNMNSQQAAPQEQDVAAYKINIVTRDDEDEEFDF